MKTLDQNLDNLKTKISNLNQIALPEGQKELINLLRRLTESTRENPVTFYVGSCPDYSVTNGKYDLQSVGSGVPFLTKVHIATDIRLLQTLDQLDIPYKYTILLADVEAEDSFFCQKFTEGSVELFLEKCRTSMRATESYLAVSNCEGELSSSSFYSEFGRDIFLTLQQRYQLLLEEKFKSDSSFNMRVVGDIIKRTEMYDQMYGEIIARMNMSERLEFLAVRTIRTMAQYLTLARLIALKSPKKAVIINHPTTNNGMFNDRNRFVLSGEERLQHETIPVVKMLNNVY